MKRLLDFLVPDGSKHLLNAPAIISLATFVLFIHAILVDVVIHPFFFTAYCIIPLLIPGAALAALGAYHIARKKTWAAAGIPGVFGLLFLPVLGAAIFWIVLAKTPAWVAAMAFGTPHSEVRAFEIQSRGGKGCGYRAEVVDDLRLYPAYLCVSGGYASRYDRQRVQLRLIGDRTRLGFRITRFEHVPTPQERSQ